jgi:hypothetical protein
LVKNWPKSIIPLLLFCYAASPAAAVQLSSSSDRAGFTCSPSFGLCACDGSYENCNAMEQSCKDQKIACALINNQKLCTCLMATKINAAPADDVENPRK